MLLMKFFAASSYGAALIVNVVLASAGTAAALIVNVLVSAGSRKEVILKVRDGLSEGAIEGMTEG
jgi:hypothetical protein